jgi:hypothetical protein
MVPFCIRAIFYRVAGSTGFILANISMVVLYDCLLRQFLLVAGVARRPAERNATCQSKDGGVVYTCQPRRKLSICLFPHRWLPIE